MSSRFSSVLIANRGEIACRIIRAAHAEGYRAIAVYSDADADALHVRLADAAMWIGPAAPAQSYLSVAGVIAAAKEVKLGVPLVVRMKGTNEDIGRRILRESGLPIISADNMADAAQKIVAAVAGK